jgi:hypothetical protein
MARKQAAQDSPYPHTLEWNTDADTYDLVRMTLNAARQAAPYIDWPKDIPRAEAGRVAWELARDRITYVREDGDQLVRMPWRSLADGNGDCKSLAVFVGALCKAAGCRVVMRYVQYPGDEHYGHVYAVVDGVPCDPELDHGTEVTTGEHYLSKRV